MRPYFPRPRDVYGFHHFSLGQRRFGQRGHYASGVAAANILLAVERSFSL